jgi:SEC-C motif-containing protein
VKADKLAVCPCGGGQGERSYAQCCGRYIDGSPLQTAPDAEALMRSRYTAYVREDAAYLRATWHTSRRPATLKFEPGCKWLGLEVREHKALDATHAEVEFVARMRSAKGQASRLHERSRFLREADGRWYYVDGDLH